MGQVLITRCEFVYWEDSFLYEAESDLFDDIAEDCELPLYDLIYDVNQKKFFMRRKEFN